MRSPYLARHPQSHPSAQSVPSAQLRDARAPYGNGHAGWQDGSLTGEEVNILTLMAQGLALDGVAARVGVSPRTVRRRLRRLCDRLGVTHPIQAIVWAVRRGLI